MVGPVAVGADPDLEERRLALDHRPVRRRRERPDPGPGPDQREPEREVDLALPAGSLAVDEPLPLGGDLSLAHPRPDQPAHVLHRGGCDVVRDPHALDLLRRLDHPRLVDHGHRVGGVRPRVEPALHERRRLAHHPVGRLRAERQLESDLPVRCGNLLRELEHAVDRRARVGWVVPGEEADVARPGHPLGVVGARLEADQRRLTLAREDDRVVALHAPEVRQVEDVVGRADDERVEIVLAHQGLHSIDLRLVALPTQPARPPRPTAARVVAGAFRVPAATR